MTLLLSASASPSASPMRELIDFYTFYKHGIFFSLCAGGAFAFAHELMKYAVKRWVLKIPYK